MFNEFHYIKKKCHATEKDKSHFKILAFYNVFDGVKKFFLLDLTSTRNQNFLYHLKEEFKIDLQKLKV